MMATEKAFLVYITAKDREQARSLGMFLVERRLAACVNVVPAVDSFYRWEGKVVEEQEAVLLAKTVDHLVQPLMEAVQSRHSYQVPALLAIPLERVEERYHQWLAGEVAPRPDPE